MSGGAIDRVPFSTPHPSVHCVNVGVLLSTVRTLFDGVVSHACMQYVDTPRNAGGRQPAELAAATAMSEVTMHELVVKDEEDVPLSNKAVIALTLRCGAVRCGVMYGMR